ncbi:MAG: hypothetical protein KME20_28750 [Kaiparowitsia implicata GSE-PSE-MK54-09C]|nr:hypothetical protein [Kaiparowitsia implicata GSE-PSE-MK54-09C]
MICDRHHRFLEEACPGCLACSGFRFVFHDMAARLAWIFRLIETVAVEAIRSGEECISLDSFDAEELVLPLVAMTRGVEARLQRRAVG